MILVQFGLGCRCNGGWARWGPKEVTDKLVPTVAGSVE